MRAAPPVSVCGSGGRVWRFVQAVLPALAAAVFAFWALAHAGLALLPRLTVASSAALVAGTWAWRQARTPVGVLEWDGQRWALDGTSGRLAVMVDLGGWLLLRLRPDSGAAARWLAITAGEAGAALPALRAAVYSPPAESGARALPNSRASD